MSPVIERLEGACEGHRSAYPYALSAYASTGKIAEN